MSSRLADLILEQSQKVGRKADAWTIFRAGGTIALADATTTRQREDRLTADRERVSAEEDGAFGREYRRTHAVANR